MPSQTKLNQDVKDDDNPAKADFICELHLKVNNGLTRSYGKPVDKMVSLLGGHDHACMHASQLRAC
jgi:hypothetical protein